MIEVKIDLIPHGHPTDRSQIARAVVVNLADHWNRPYEGNYRVEFYRYDDDEPYVTTYVTGHQRHDGIWKLLATATENCEGALT